MAAWGYEFYLRVLKVSLTRSLRSLVIEILSALGDKIRIPARPCNILNLMPNDICGSLQSFSAMALKTKTL